MSHAGLSSPSVPGGEGLAARLSPHILHVYPPVGPYGDCFYAMRRA